MLVDFLTNLKNRSSQKRISIFCGAGISFDSGLPVAKGLLEKICSSLDIKEEETKYLLDSNLPFESFIEAIHQEVSIDGILDVFELGVPNSNHVLFGKLLKKGVINTICTTNFDLLFERALLTEGFEEGVDFEKYHTEQDFRNFYWAKKKSSLIKLHGCITEREEIGITLDIVAGSDSSIHRNQLVKEFFSKKFNDVVIVIGYSCSDKFDISPQIEAVAQDKSEIIFVEHKNGKLDPIIKELSKCGDDFPFKSYPGIKVNIDANHFCNLLWNTFLEEDYKVIQNKTNWEEVIESWIENSVFENGRGIKYILPARLFFDISQYEISLHYCELGKQAAQETGDFKAFYSEMGNAGMALNALGRFDEALEYLKNSIVGCRMVSNQKGVIAQSQVLGHIFRNRLEYDLALQRFRDALIAAEQIKDQFSICTSIGNLCSVFNHIGHTAESEMLINKGIKIARNIGNKQSECAMLCHLGIANFKRGNASAAHELINTSLLLAQTIGDERCEAMAHINLSNIEANSGNKLAGINHARLALNISVRLRLFQEEKKARFLLMMYDLIG